MLKLGSILRKLVNLAIQGWPQVRVLVAGMIKSATNTSNLSLTYLSEYVYDDDVAILFWVGFDFEWPRTIKIIKKSGFIYDWIQECLELKWSLKSNRSSQLAWTSMIINHVMMQNQAVIVNIRNDRLCPRIKIIRQNLSLFSLLREMYSLKLRIGKSECDHIDLRI